MLQINILSSKTRRLTPLYEARYYLPEHMNGSLSKHKAVNFMSLHFLIFTFKYILSNNISAEVVLWHEQLTAIP